MGIFDFILGKKRKEQEQLRLEEEARKSLNKSVGKENVVLQKTSERNKNGRYLRNPNQYNRLHLHRLVINAMRITCLSKVCKNAKGLSVWLRTQVAALGYKLQPGIGYIVKIYNDDLGKPNMSDKPMKVVRKTSDMVELRGFPIEALSPFGWQEVDYSDYGFVVYYKNRKVEKCVLYMYDRDIRIEYKVNSNLSKENATAKLSEETTETEKFVQEALSQLSAGNDGDAVYHPLYKAWRSFQNNPEQLKHIKDFGKYGMGLMIFLSYGTVSDIDAHQQIASVSYLFLSKAIQKSPQDINLYKNRLILMISNHEAFEYTVSSVVNKDEDFMFMNLNQFKARDAMYKMEFADLLRSPLLLSISILQQKYVDLRDKIAQGFFGSDQNNTTIRDRGGVLHQEILHYLENKVIKEGDIEF